MLNLSILMSIFVENIKRKINNIMDAQTRFMSEMLQIES